MLYTLKLWICKQTSRINNEPISEIIGKGQTNHLDEKQTNFWINSLLLHHYMIFQGANKWVGWKTN